MTDMKFPSERDEAFHRNAYDLVALAFGSGNPDMIRAAAMMLVNAPADSEIGQRTEDLRKRASSELRKWIFLAKPTFSQFAALVEPLVEATLFDDGNNVFRPVPIVEGLAAKNPEYVLARETIGVADVQNALPIVLSSMFAQGVIEVVSWCPMQTAAEIEPGLLNTLSSRQDIPITCLVPTGKALVELARRILSHQLADRCGLKVPLDLVGIDYVEDGRGLPLSMPKKGRPS